MITESDIRPDCAVALMLADLQDADVLELAPGERLWKLYCFIALEGKDTGLRHHIYTKLKPDGRLALVTFALHSPAPDLFSRSNIARVPDLSPDALEKIIEAVRLQTQSAPGGYEEIDLSDVPTLDEQLERLAQDGD